MNKKRICWGFISLFMSVSLLAQGLKPIELDSALRYGILDNGLTYYIRHNDVVPDRADFYIVQNVGAILEEDNQNGLAHFLEHMAFNGTKNFPGKQIINYMESIGVQFGNNINAYTSLDETVYNLKSVPTIRESIIDTALLVLHDWSGFISLEDDEIDKERGVIREEWRTRMNANRRIWKASLPILYPNSQYSKRDVIGDTAIINNFSYDTLRAYYHRWYRPDLQAIVVVGDLDVDKVEARIKDMWKDIPKRINPDVRQTYPVYPNDQPIIAILTDEEAKTSSVEIKYRHAPMPDRVKASMAGYMMLLTHNLIESMVSDRLDEIAAKGDAPFAAGYVGYGEEVRPIDAFSLMAVPHEGKEEVAFAALLMEAERINRYGFSQAELDRAKLNMLTAYQKAYNERGKTKNGSYVNEYVRNFLDFLPVPGIEWEYEKSKEILDILTLDMVNEVAKKFVTDKNQVVEMTGPKKESVKFPSEARILEMLSNMKSMDVQPYEEKVIDTQLIDDKLKAQKVKTESQCLAIAGVTEWVLGNGMRVILQPTKLKDDEILIYGFSKGGTSQVSEMGDLVSAALCSSVASNNGMGKFNQTDLGKALAGKYVSLRPSVGTYEESFSGNSTVKDFETLLQLVYLTFKGTRKDDESYASLLNQYKAALANAEKDPNRAFQDSIRNVVSNYHPRSFSMNLKRLEELSQEKALAIFDRRFEDPKDFIVYLVGNIDLDSIRPAVETYLGGIPKQKKMKMENWIDLGVRTPKGKVENRFEREMQVNKTSNYILFSGDFPFTLKNRLTLQLIADILDIRYLESMREDEGGTYGVSVRSSLSNIPVERGSLQMSFDTDPKMEEKLLDLIHKEIEKLISEGPIDADYNKVKENLRNKYAENQKENRWVLNALISYYKDGFDLRKDYLSVLDSITKEDIQNVLKSLMDQGNEIKVIMAAKQ